MGEMSSTLSLHADGSRPTGYHDTGSPVLSETAYIYGVALCPWNPSALRSNLPRSSGGNRLYDRRRRRRLGRGRREERCRFIPAAGKDKHAATCSRNPPAARTAVLTPLPRQSKPAPTLEHPARNLSASSSPRRSWPGSAGLSERSGTTPTDRNGIRVGHERRRTSRPWRPAGSSWRRLHSVRIAAGCLRWCGTRWYSVKSWVPRLGSCCMITMTTRPPVWSIY